MNDTLIVTIFTAIDDVMTTLDHRTHVLSHTSDIEVLTVATVAACHFQNHHQRALCVLRGMHYLSGSLSLSRFNRRLHALAHWFSWLLDLLCDLFAFRAAAFTIDSLPVPVCQRVRARRCRKVRGGEYYGYCAAKEKRFFGWRLHLICGDMGVPVSYEVLPARYHNLTPLLDLVPGLPTDGMLYGDKGYNCSDNEAWLEGECGVHLIPARKQHMEPNTYGEWLQLRRQRAVIESVNSQLAAWGVQRLHARTHEGFVIKLLASLLALVIVNAQ